MHGVAKWLAGSVKPILVGSFAVLLLAACGSSGEPAPAPTATAVGVDGLQSVETQAAPSPTPQPSPSPTATPEPVATATPIPTPTARPPDEIAEAEAVSALVERLGGQAMDFLRTFTEEVSPRASATEQERAAADFLLREFDAMGYPAELQPFTVDVTVSDVLVGPERQAFQNLPMALSGEGKASGPLVHVGRAFEEDMPSASLAGKIALVQRGNISFEEKVGRVAGAGALAAVVYNNRPGPFAGRLMTQAEIPVVSVSRESGEAILEVMAIGRVEATVSVSLETHDSQNVIAEKPGDGAGILVLGGHYDTVPNVPGANDNGSGIATLATVAREVSKKTYPFTLRFVAFGSEELGLVGSEFYVSKLSREERSEIIAMLNLDALAGGGNLGVLGDSGLASQVVAYGRKNGIDVGRRSSVGRGASSDHASFQRVGVPVVFFLDDNLSRIHTPEDKIELVRVASMGKAAALATALLDWLAGP